MTRPQHTQRRLIVEADVIDLADAAEVVGCSTDLLVRFIELGDVAASVDGDGRKILARIDLLAYRDARIAGQARISNAINALIEAGVAY